MPNHMDSEGRLIWIDLEMTGLDTGRDSILEIATVVTDSNLQRPRRRPGARDRAPAWRCSRRWTTGTARSTASPGCGSACSTASVTLGEAEARTLAFLSRMGAGQRLADVRQLDLPGPPFPASPDAGAGKPFPLSQPRRQHASRNWRAAGRRTVLAGVRKQSAHTALSDVRDSIAELRLLSAPHGALAGLPATERAAWAGAGGIEALRTLSLATAACCCAPLCLPARDARQDKPVNAYFRETWTTREGLPHNQVNAIAQTPDGYLWFGTWEGLVRYNGLEFHVFDRRNTPALRDNGIRSIRVAPDGALVVGTSRGGVSVLRDGAWRTYGKRDGLAQDEIMDAVLDREGAPVGRHRKRGHDAHRSPTDACINTTRRPGFRRTSPSAWCAIATTRCGCRPPRASCASSATRRLSSTTKTTDCRTRRSSISNRWPTARCSPAPSAARIGASASASNCVSATLPADGVPSLVRDNAGDLWVGTINHGLLRLGADGTLDNLSSQKGLPNNRVAALFVDREGSLWAGTNAGLLRLRDAPFTHLQHRAGPERRLRARASCRAATAASGSAPAAA